MRTCEHEDKVTINQVQDKSDMSSAVIRMDEMMNLTGIIASSESAKSGG